MLVGRIFLPFISKWSGREMGFYVPLSPKWEPGLPKAKRTTRNTVDILLTRLPGSADPPELTLP